MPLRVLYRALRYPIESSVHASLRHCRGIARAGAHRLDLRAACRSARGPRFHQSRPAPTPARLRTRRPPEDREGSSGGPGGHSSRADHRRAHRPAHPEPRLGQLGARAGGGGSRRGRRSTAPADGAAAGTCRPFRRAEVQFSRRALHSGARVGARDGGARGRGRRGQAVAARIRLRSSEPRHRRGPRAPGTRGIVERNRESLRQSRFAAALRGCRGRRAHEAGSGPRAARRRHRRRHLRGGGAQRAAGPGHARGVGRQARRPAGADHDVPAGGEGSRDRRRRCGRFLVRQRSAGRDWLRQQDGSALCVPAIAPADSKAASPTERTSSCAAI